MIRSKIAISSRNYYSCELTRRIPIKVSILAINGTEGLGFYEPLDGKQETLEKYVQLMKKSNQIVEFQVTHKSPTRYWTRVVHKLDYPSIHDTILESGSMSILPIIIRGGVQYHTILSPSSQSFRTLLTKLRKRFTQIDLKALYSRPSKQNKDILTPKQFEAFVLAFNKGYYQISKKCSLKDLAKNLGISRVAFQERLKRAELRIFTSFVEDINFG
ncbi:MAG: helix-turn-helix domain-containing protein [Candidatus Heimdallarchaeaceae archaeon]